MNFVLFIRVKYFLVGTDILPKFWRVCDEDLLQNFLSKPPSSDTPFRLIVKNDKL